MSDSSLPSVDASIDWLTVTATKQERRLHFVNFARQLVKLENGRGGLERPWHWKGYSGATSNGVKWGTRQDSDILQIAGGTAGEWFDQAWTHSDNCSRLDLAATIKVEGKVSDYIHRHSEEALALKAEKGSGPSVSVIWSEGSPATLYVGRRESDLFGRVYDKGLESGDLAYDKCIRYELEVKGEPAYRGAARVHSAADRPGVIRNALWEFFTRRGVRPIYRCMGEPVRIANIRQPSDAATRLGWLSSQVAPAVKRLIAEGLWREVFEALELPHSLTEKFRLSHLAECGHHKDYLEGEWTDEPCKHNPS
jgi:hypothetical protein